MIKKALYFYLFGLFLFPLACTNHKPMDANSPITRDTILANHLIAQGDSLLEKNRDSSKILYQQALKLVDQLPDKKIDALLKLSQSYWEPFDTLAFIYANRALTIADSINDIDKKAKATYYLGRALVIDGKFEQANGILNQTIALSNKFGRKKTVMDALIQKGLVNISLKQYDTAIISVKNAILLANELSDSSSLAFANARLGFIYLTMTNFKEALKYFYIADNLSEHISSGMIKSWIYNSMASCLSFLEEYKLAEDYCQKSIELNEKFDNKISNIDALICLCGIYYDSKSNLDKALNLANKALNLAIEIKDFASISNAYQTLGVIQLELNFYDKALLSFLNANSYYIEKDFYNNYYSNLANISEVFFKKGNFSKCIEYAEKAQFDDKYLIKKQSNYYISLSFDSLHQPEKALYYYKLYTQAKDSILNQEKSKQIKQMEAIYQSEKKQQQIDLQQAQLTNKDLQIQQQHARLLVIVLVATSLLVISAGFIYFFRRKKQQQLLIAQQNQELAQQQYHNLYQQSQLQAIREKLTGQEEERARIARELHDGIGGTLAAVKMRMELASSQPNPEDIASLAKIVNSTWEEVRTISHNLMPPQFSEVSIDQVLANHIRELNKPGKIGFSIQFLPQTGWQTVPVNIQVELYRIVQELCSNIIKYSSATQVEIQLAIDENGISLTMEDNGQPFDYKDSGIGYRNLQERIKLLNGNFEKSSGNENGNTWLIQIPVVKVITE